MKIEVRLACGLAAALFLAAARVAFACGLDPAPPPAAVAGFTCETMDIAFTSFAAVDRANRNIALDWKNTNAPGFDFYPYIKWPYAAWPGFGSNGPMARTDYSIKTAAGCGAGQDNVTKGLCLDPISDDTTNKVVSCSVAGNDNSAGYVGVIFTRNFYLDVAARWRDNGTSSQYPSIYTLPLEFFLTMLPGSQFYVPYEPYVHYDEKDLLDPRYSGGLNDWQWRIATSNGSYLGNQLSANQGPTYGVLVQSQSSNIGGHIGYGRISFYANDRTLDSTVLFSKNGPPIPNPDHYGIGVYGTTDTDHSCLILSAGHGSPLFVTSVKAWGPPRASHGRKFRGSSASRYAAPAAKRSPAT
jgi:hypothetical protein